MLINKDTYYVGVNDRTKDLFESLWPLPFGISYNSYLITSGRKTALIDTVDVNFYERYHSQLQAILGDRCIDYLIINHMEPDHSGAIRLLQTHYPDIRVVGNRKTLEMLEGYYGFSDPHAIVVGDGDTLAVGDHRLRFFLTPMIHWPETMMTCDETTQALFSGDAFGSFGALNGSPLDTHIDTTPYWTEMERYYANIVGKYGAMVQRALTKLNGIDIKMLCSTHGPVWQEHLPQVINTYNRLSRYEGEKGAVVCYGSMYGNTTQMAEAVCEGLVEAGIRKIVMHDVTRTHHSFILADVFRYQALLLGSVTYNGQLFPPMQTLVEELSSRDIKNRFVGCFGSYTWSGQAVRKLCEFVADKMLTGGSEPVEMKQGFTSAVAEQCRTLGRQTGERLLNNLLTA